MTRRRERSEPPHPARLRYALAALLTLAAGCAIVSLDLSPEAAARVWEQDQGTLPYHPFVYHLDLSVLTYQLYGQSLVWPFDPYHEGARDRPAFMARVHDWAERTGAEQVRGGVGIEGYRGPGVLGGFDDNPRHDPIVYQYSRLHPWSDTLTNPGVGGWLEYLTPRQITGQIAEVHVCSRTTGATRADYDALVPGAITLDSLTPGRDDADPGARDILMAFEGETGDKGQPGQPGSQSLMGFALLRATEGEAYDLHIAFRGSRSGSAARAALEALSTNSATGNPDWITDLGFREEHHPEISPDPAHVVSRGMANSVVSMFPTLYHCLDQIAGPRPTAPTHITVTGHSLGGGLAQHFASALLLGDTFGPEGERMPSSLRGWPWRALKLITFSAPRVGNAAWADELTTHALDSQFHVTNPGNPYDLSAIAITDLTILPRLLDAAAPAGYRVLIPTDPITTGRLPIGRPVGQAVFVVQPSVWDWYAPPETRAHDPLYVRQFMTDTLRSGAPPTAAPIPDGPWAYHDPAELDPEYDPSAEGSLAGYQRLAETLRRYYADPAHPERFFDLDGFEANFAIYLELLSP